MTQINSIKQKSSHNNNEFTCIQEKEGCYKGKRDKLEPCVKSPCPLNLTKFGIHERIVEHYLIKQNYADVYYYFKDLLSMSYFNCDIQKLEKIREEKGHLEPIDYPPNCRVFIFSRKLKSLRRDIAYYRNLPYNELSEEGKENYKRKIKEFQETTDSAMEVLCHLVIDKIQKEKQKEEAHRRDLERMDKLAKYKIPSKVENFGESFSKNIQEDHKILTGEERAFKEKKLINHKTKEKGEEIEDIKE
jgi:hypothetical protein